jgi:hypothetical protein
MMMRITIGLVLLVAFLAACGPAGVVVTPEVSPLPDSSALITVTPAAYPYPDPVEPDFMPTGYPEILVTIPAGDLDEENMTATPNSLTGSTTTDQPVDSPTPPSYLSGMITTIARDLSAQTDVPLDEITFVSAEPMIWPNAGLGCPDPAMAYAEVMVEGLLVTMAAGNREFQYHTGGLDRFVLCRDGLPVSSGNVP